MPAPSVEAAPDPPPALDPEVAALCAPLSDADPCGPDLDLEADADYFNYVAQVEGILPTSYFSLEDGRPFDPTTIDIDGQLTALKPLMARSRDLRLLIARARLVVLKRDLSGFAATVAAMAELLENLWDAVHPRPQDGDATARATVIAALDAPTVIFPLQYTPFFEAPRVGPISYRGWMIAMGEAKPRTGDQPQTANAITEAIIDADPAVLAGARKHMRLLKSSLDRIRNAFMLQGSSAGLQGISTLAGKMLAFIDPQGAATEATATAGATAADGSQAKHDAGPAKPAGPAPTSIGEAREALAAIADYYSRCEPSSPTLPLVRQAHQLIGKSFLEVITILVPSQIDKAAFQIGSDQFFDLPVGKLSGLSEVSPVSGGNGADPAGDGQTSGPAERRYTIEARSQAIAMLDLVQRYFRQSEPSSPVPMLCERARMLAERDFMSVLRDVLPKSALKTIGADK
jgi:type VI secretion system protein ImpA